MNTTFEMKSCSRHQTRLTYSLRSGLGDGYFIFIPAEEGCTDGDEPACVHFWLLGGVAAPSMPFSEIARWRIDSVTYLGEGNVQNALVCRHLKPCAVLSVCLVGKGQLK